MRRVEALGVGFAVAELGPADGPPVLLLHGFPETHRSFQHVAPVLAEAGHRVFLVDLKGYGESDKPIPDPSALGGPSDYRLTTLANELAALIEALGYQHMPLVGHDWGGILVSALLLVAPERASRVALLNAPARRFLPWTPRHIYTFNLPGVAERRFWRRPVGFVTEVLTEWGGDGPTKFTDEDIRIYTRSLQSGPSFRCAMGYYRSLHREAATLVRALLRPPRVTPPALVLFGALDPIMPPTVARMAAKDLGAELELVEDAGHFVQTDAPERVSAALLRFLAASDSRSARAAGPTGAFARG